MELIAVFFGGGAGATARFYLSKIINQNAGILFPAGTFIVNIIGCLLIGFIFRIFEDLIVPDGLKLLIITGFLGGFTTFSSFSLESVNLIRSNELLNAVFNILLSVVLGLVFVVAGMILAKLILQKWR